MIRTYESQLVIDDAGEEWEGTVAIWEDVEATLREKDAEIARLREALENIETTTGMALPREERLWRIQNIAREALGRDSSKEIDTTQSTGAEINFEDIPEEDLC